MATNLCSGCGQPIGLTNTGFCPHCGMALATMSAEGSPAPPNYQPYSPQFAYETATPSPVSALPLPPLPPPPSSITPPMPTNFAISPGRATGVTLAAVGVMLVMGIFNFSTYAITSMLVIAGVFWYGILRLSYDRIVKVWLISSVASILMLGGTTLVVLYFEYFQYSSRSYAPYFLSNPAFWTRHLLNTFITAMVYSAIGVGLASGFARWRDLRAPSTARQNVQDFLRAFGIAIGYLIASYGCAFAALRYPFQDNGEGFISLFAALVVLLLFSLGSLSLPFFARGNALQRLRKSNAAQFIPSAKIVPLPDRPGLASYSAYTGPPLQLTHSGLNWAIVFIFGGAVFSAFTIPDFFITGGGTITAFLTRNSQLFSMIFLPGLAFVTAPIVACITAMVLPARIQTTQDPQGLKKGTMVTAIGSAIAGLGLMSYYAYDVITQVHSIDNRLYYQSYLSITYGPGFVVTGGLLILGGILALLRLRQQ